MAERSPLINQTDGTADDTSISEVPVSIRSRRSGNHLSAYYDNAYNHGLSGIPLIVRDRSSSGTPPSLRAGSIPSGGTLTDDDDAVDVEIDPAKDTLQGIAVRYYTSVAKLKRLNQLSTEQAFYGRRSLKVPHTNFGMFIGKLVDLETSSKAIPGPSTSVMLKGATGGEITDDIHNHHGEGDTSDAGRETRQFLQSKDKQLEVLRQNVTNSIIKQKKQTAGRIRSAGRNSSLNSPSLLASDLSSPMPLYAAAQHPFDAVDSAAVSPDGARDEIASSPESTIDLTSDYKVTTALPRTERPYDKMMSWRAILCALLAIISIPVIIVILILIDNEKPPPDR